MSTIIDTDYQEIRPEDVDATQHLWNTFGRSEDEVSAGYIVRLCQARGAWASFCFDDVEKLYQAAGHKDGYTFNGLLDRGFIIKGTSGRYYITLAFVLACGKCRKEAKS